MQNDLQINWNIKSIVLYDKANTEIFKPLNNIEK